MTTRITLTTPQSAVIAGVQFHDGIAELPRLGDNTREFFRTHGATIEELSPEGKTLDTMTKGELLTFAAEQTPPIELPGVGALKVGEVRDIVKAAAASRAGIPASGDAAGVVSTPVVGPETVLHEAPAVETASVVAAHEGE